MRPLFFIGHLLCWAFVAATANAQYASSNMTLADQFDLNQIGGGSGADIWGWTDPMTNREYALMARSNGTAFVDVTDPFNSVYLGNLPSAAGNDIWRDVKTYGNYAYIVADGSVGPHGLQVFDLTNLRGVTSPQTFSTTFNENSFRNAHNIAINEESGFAYVIGSNESGGRALAYDLSNPGVPAFVNSIDVDGYIHDAQIVTYHGPDPTYAGREVMFSASSNDFVIIDVDDKSAPFRIWEDTYPGVQYVHQGWLSEDHTIFYQNDELDSTWTHRWDVSDLDEPVYLGSTPISPGAGSAIDHNLYVKGNYIYAANYTSGVRLFEITDPTAATFDEVGWLDTYPANNGSSYNGAWSVYPYFESGTIISSDINSGLFVSRVDVRPADFNADGFVNCDDIDQLTKAIASQSEQPWFDLTGDGDLDLDDRDAWLSAAGTENLTTGYLLGDINLDGVVDGGDFLIWNSNKFSTSSHWCSGDVNADGVVDGGDFLIWNSNKFQSSDVASVPEPGTLVLVLMSAALALRFRRQR